MFLIDYTRPDIAYAINKLSRYTYNPSNEHWNTLNRLLKYLKGTITWKLKFVRYLVVLKGYYDATR